MHKLAALGGEAVARDEARRQPGPTKALSISSGRETVKVLACRDALHDKQKCRILVLEVGVETGSLVAEKIQDIETDKVSSRPRLDRASTSRVETTKTANTCGIFPDQLKHLQVAPRIERRRSWACHASIKPSSRPQPRRRGLVTSSRRAQSRGFGTKKSSSTDSLAPRGAEATLPLGGLWCCGTLSQVSQRPIPVALAGQGRGLASPWWTDQSPFPARFQLLETRGPATTPQRHWSPK